MVLAPLSVLAQGLVESARSLQQLGEHEAAVVVLQRALAESSAERGRILYRMAESELALGRSDAAAAHLREALALPDDEWVAAHTADVAALLARASGAAAASPSTEGPSEAAPHPGALPPSLVDRFGADTLPPLPGGTEWSPVYRVQAFLGAGLFAPDDDFGKKANALLVCGAELTGGLFSIFAFRVQARFGLTLLNVKQFSSWDPPGPYYRAHAYGDRRDLFVDLSLGLRANVGAGLFVGVGGRFGYRRIHFDDEAEYRPRGYDRSVEGDAIAGQIVRQAVVELGWRSDHIGFRIEGSAGRPRASLLGIVTIPIVTL